MAMSSPFTITLTPLDESVLHARARSSKSAHRDVIRARIVLRAAEGAANTAIAAEVGVHVDTVRKWRRRFVAAGLPGLDDLPRSGRRRVFTPVQVVEVKALACTLPAETGQPLSRWSSADLASEVITRGLAETISAATVRRWLAADAIKPWQHRSWIFPRDPDFATKAARVLDLYARQWTGQPLGPDDYVISADEKSQLQALDAPPPGTTARTRTHPTRRVRVPPRWHPGLLRRLRRPPGPGARPDRPQDRHRTLREAGGPRHDDRTVCLGPTGVLGRRLGFRGLMASGWPTCSNWDRGRHTAPRPHRCGGGGTHSCRGGRIPPDRRGAVD